MLPIFFRVVPLVFSRCAFRFFTRLANRDCSRGRGRHRQNFFLPPRVYFIGDIVLDVPNKAVLYGWLAIAFNRWGNVQ
jgi:hypothetical protein